MKIYLSCILLAAFCCWGDQADAQKKLLVLGSSTPACFNLLPDSCYIGRLQRHYLLRGTPVVIDNRAVSGDNCYQGMPTWYTPPLGRSTARPYFNISDGLQGNPDIVLVNYPSNGYDVYSVEEVLNCLRTIKQTANNAGKPCYIATSQPRSEPSSFQSPEVRQRMQVIKESIINEFGQYAINFWDGIVNPASNSLLDQYNSGDGTHLNNAGHNVLFNRVAEKNLFGQQQSGGLTYRYYEGDWNALPDFNALAPVKAGSASNINLNARNTNDYFGFVWEGNIHITTPGWYTFETVSDDGSKFYFNSSYAAGANALVSNDGTHGPVSVAGSVYISAAGSYPVAATFFEKTAGEIMQVYWSGPGIERQLIPDYAFTGTPPPPASGLSYRYYEGSWDALPDFNQLQPVRTGSSTNLDIGVRTTGRNANYAFVWQGTINIPVAGTYTFETISDDGSKVYFNSLYNPSATATVNNDGLHAPVSVSGSVYVPTPGTYPISITFFEKEGGEHIEFYWSGPGFARQPVPDAAFAQGAAPTGLNYKYYEGTFDALPDFNALTPVKTGTSANLDLGVRTAGVDNRFALMWQGYINLPSAGTYTFETISDDGSKLYFDMPYSAWAVSLVNNDGLHAPRSATGTVTVPAAGMYPVTITYFEKEGGEIMQLYWTGPGISRQQVPDQAFSTSNFATGAAVLSGVQKTQAAEVKSAISQAIASIYPNPFRQSFTIDYYHDRSAQNKVSIGIYNLNGRLVYTHQPATLVSGLNRWTVHMGNRKLAAGMYVARVNINGIAVKAIKVVKVGW